MKVLLTCSSSSRTGPVEGLLSLGQWLRQRGIDAHFAGDTVRPGEELDAHLAAAGVPWERSLRLSRKLRFKDVLHDARTLPKLGFDLIHAAMAHDHHLALWARRSNPRLKVVRSAERAEDVARTFVLRRSNGVVVHASQYRRRLLDAGLQERKVAWIPGFVDADRFKPGPSSMRARWGVPADAPLAGIVARMKPERGHRTLLEAFHRLAPKNAWLVLIGRGEEEAPLRTIAGERVVLGGYARGDELVDAYRALDLAVWLREGNDGACRGVLEAMACGVPVVAGSTGAPPDYVKDGVSGRIVEASDAARLGTALRDVLLAPETRRRMGTEARARASSFTPDRAHQATLAFWQSL